MKKIWEEDTEYLSYVKELLATDSVQRLKKFIHHYYANRLEHSLNVSYTSFRIAKKLKLNARSTARAGLLHDLFFYFPKDYENKKIKEKGHAYIHSRIAVCESEKITELSDLERDIILKHMWGRTLALPRYKESYIVSLVDKYWALREVSIPLMRKFRNPKIFRRKSVKEVMVD